MWGHSPEPHHGMASTGVTLPARPLLRARSAWEQAPHTSFHKPQANLNLLLGSSGRDRKYLNPGGAETAALQRCRGCRGICCDCLRTLWHFAGICREPSHVQKAWEIQPVNLLLLVLRHREWNPLSRECAQGLFITHSLCTRGLTSATLSHLGHRCIARIHQSQFRHQICLHAAGRYSFSQSSKHLLQTSFRRKKIALRMLWITQRTMFSITGTVTTQPVTWNSRALLPHLGTKQPLLCSVFHRGWLFQNPKIP